MSSRGWDGVELLGIPWLGGFSTVRMPGCVLPVLLDFLFEFLHLALSMGRDLYCPFLLLVLYCISKILEAK